MKTLSDALAECVLEIRAARESGVSWCMRCGVTIACDGHEDELGEIELCSKCSEIEAAFEENETRERCFCSVCQDAGCNACA